MPTLPQEVIRRKRDGLDLTTDEIGGFITGLVNGQVSGEQGAAFAMAVFFRGMNAAETVALTEAMTRSGRVLDWSSLDLSGPVVDKHSTGGIGDNVSLMLAPMVAACGAYVPMISGRGLGHSGGTLDKLESIPGYRVSPDLPLFRATLKEAGCAIIGATADLAPADRILYGIRDVTATVESIPLITASILSKKRASGLQALVMDVKTGSGAFMRDLPGARALAKSIVAVSNQAGLPASGLITDMSQALASAAGNMLEVRNAVRYLTGVRRDERLHAVVLALGAEMLLKGGLVADVDEGHARLQTVLDNGAAAERFGRMVSSLGGPTDIVEKLDQRLIEAPVRFKVMVDRHGYVQAVDARALGLAVVALGGGRTRPEDSIDGRVGFDNLAPIGAKVDGRPLGIVHAATEEQAERAADALRHAYEIGETPPEQTSPILERITA